MIGETRIVRAAAVLLVAVSGAGAAAHGGDEGDCSYFAIAAGRRPDLQIATGTGDWMVEKRGRRISVTRDGRAVPPEAIEREGRVVRVRDERGETVLMLGLREDPGPDGQIIYTPDLDPTSVPARLGFRTEPLQPEIARHLGLDPDAVAVVDSVCGEAAAAAGLLEDDIIVAVDGRAPVSQARLARAAGAKSPGERLVLRVRRRGEEREIAVPAVVPGAWPEPERLDGHIQSALHR